MRGVGVLVVSVLCACNTPMKPRVGGKPGEYETPESFRADIERASTLGRAIWENDLVSARATDVLLQDAKIDFAGEGLQGWVTFKQDDHHHVVQFVKTLPDGTLAAAYEVPFEPDSPRESGLQKYEPPVPLEPRVAAMFRARTTALRSMKTMCGNGLNPVVLPAELVGKAGWLVYVLASSNRAGDLVLAGHRLFRVSEDGERIEEDRPLSRTCLISQADPKQGTLVAQFLTNPLGPTPHEGHVFTSLLYRLPLYVMGENKLWKVEGQQIVFMGVQ